jgi:comEA protein
MQIPGFTSQETKVLILLLAALVMGTGLTWYKRTHPKFAPELILQRNQTISLPQSPGNPKNRPDARTLNINQATAEELQLLSGIGPSLSRRIVEYRETGGGFRRIEDIMQVKGIGPNIFERIKDRITVEADSGRESR